MGDAELLRIQALEKENEQLRKERNFWQRDAIKWCAESGELKFKIEMLMQKYSRQGVKMHA